MAQPLQIVITGDSPEKENFTLNEENLASIIEKIPDGMKVSIVSVVGAFRTGKSFLLNFFLRYLRSGDPENQSYDWMVTEGEELTEGNMNEGWSMVDKDQEKTLKSFAWKGGQERQTTGIWMWSEPFIHKSSTTDEDLAVLLMDTQGMFDNETTMTLTAQIFGLSTLVSSYQIYNVDKRIQEDNLQHLALFSEYGRMALQPQGAEKPKLEIGAAKALKPEEKTEKPTEIPAENIENPPKTNEENPEIKKSEAEAEKPKPKAKEVKKPFQRLQFLLRDWQSFDVELEEDMTSEKENEVYQGLCKEMQKYLDDVIKNRGSTDLQSTREQILRCFNKVDCFMLPHPGFAVTKKNYDGNIGKIETFFRLMINKYVRYVFDQELSAKEVNGRKITGKELQTFFKVYVKMFQAGQKSFPKAMTMLEATAEANNRNAYDLAFHSYKKGMNSLLDNENSTYVKEDILQAKHDELYISSFSSFEEIANMGSPEAILKTKNKLKLDIESEKTRYFETNALRNPFKDVEMFIVPVIIATVAWFIAVIVNATCSTDFCEATEDTFVNVYLFIFFGIIVLTWRHIRGAIMYFKELLPILLNTANNGGFQAAMANAKKTN